MASNYYPRYNYLTLTTDAKWCAYLDLESVSLTYLKKYLYWQKPENNWTVIQFSPYNRLSGQQILSGTQIISTSHGMTVRNFFDVFLPFYLLLKLPIKKLLVFFFRSTRIIRSISDSLFELIWYGPDSDNPFLAKKKY
jgi:hypothetical protein